jgi:hypothetical protein
LARREEEERKKAIEAKKKKDVSCIVWLGKIKGYAYNSQFLKYGVLVLLLRP